MNKYMTKTQFPEVSAPRHAKAAKVSAPQPIQDIPHPKANQSAMPSHEDIARRAYQIYLERGCPQDQSEDIWRQAEQEQLEQSLVGSFRR